MLNTISYQGFIKTTIRYHFTPTRKAIIPKKEKMTSIDKYVETLESSYIASGDVKRLNHCISQFRLIKQNTIDWVA